MQHYYQQIGGGLLSHHQYRSNYTGKFFASPLKDMREQTIFAENEKTNPNNSYRQWTKHDDQTDRYFSSYDMGVLIGNGESYLEGRINSRNDVDCYSFSYRQKAFYERMGISASVTIQLEDLSAGKEIELSVYDTKGNYLGAVKDCGNGCKELTLPEYEGCPNQFVLRVTGGDGQEAGGETYRIKIKESREERSGAAREGKAAPGERKTLSEIRQEIYRRLPEDEQYHGEESLEGLLGKWASGEGLSVSEKNYLKVFSNLSDYERAETLCSIQNTLYPQIQDELRRAGISIEGEWGITIDIYGTVSVSGEMAQEEREAISAMIEETFADRLWDSYMQASDYSKQEYRGIEAYKEVNEFITKATGGAYSLADIGLADGGSRIIGLPEKMCNMLNSQECNGRYEQLRDDIYLLMDEKRKGRIQETALVKAVYRFGKDRAELV